MVGNKTLTIAFLELMGEQNTEEENLSFILTTTFPRILDLSVVCFMKFI